MGLKDGITAIHETVGFPSKTFSEEFGDAKIVDFDIS